jgi:hypothetical protein
VVTADPASPVPPLPELPFEPPAPPVAPAVLPAEPDAPDVVAPDDGRPGLGAGSFALHASAVAQMPNDAIFKPSRGAFVMRMAHPSRSTTLSTSVHEARFPWSVGNPVAKEKYADAG